MENWKTIYVYCSSCRILLSLFTYVVNQYSKISKENVRSITIVLFFFFFFQVNFSKKKRNRMRNNEAAIIALSKSRSQFFHHKDTDSLVDNEAVIVYDERTALWYAWFCESYFVQLYILHTYIIGVTLQVFCTPSYMVQKWVSIWYKISYWGCL